MASRRARSPRSFAPIAPSEVLAFGASWCAPWQVLRPSVEELVAAGLPVRLVDVDEEAGLAETHRVISLPTFVLLREGAERRRILGAVSAAELRALFPKRR